MPRRPVPMVETFQAVEDNRLIENLTFSPPQPQRLWVSNVFRRVFAHIVARPGTGTTLLEGTADGLLKVSLTADLPTTIETAEGTAGDAHAAVLSLTTASRSIVVLIAANNAVLKVSVDGTTYSDEWTVNAGEAVAVDVAVKAVSIKNATPGSNATYRVWATV